MAIVSMTGFARSSGAAAHRSWTWELRSVNGRGLDLRCRLPQGYDHLEATARTMAARHLVRGNVSITLSVSESSGATRLTVNRELLDRLIALSRELEPEPGISTARLDGLLAIRGVVETGAALDESVEARSAHEAAVMDSLAAGLEGLRAARVEEGVKLAESMSGHLDEIAAHRGAAAAVAAAQPEAIRARLEAQLRALLGADPPIAADRLAQEVAMLAARADVREELDRLDAHIAAARALIAEGGAIGRRLDFLAQEFNRETNTLCSKSADIELTRIGLALKAAVDRLREQAQNIE